MEQVNVNSGSLATAPWYASGSVYMRDYTFPNGNKYTATIIPNPTDWIHPFSVTSVATVNPNGSGLLAALGLGTAAPSVARAVQVKTTRSNLLIKGMVAKHTIDMNGQDISTDSFDSTDPAWSTLGRYDSTKTRANGDVATNEAITNALSSGNANIYGHVSTGPGGSVSVNVNGGVGEQSWVASHPGQIEPGYLADNSNFTFPETSLPYTSGLNPSNNLTITVTNYITGTNGGMVWTNAVPIPLPFGGVITNISYASTGTLPNPIPAGLVTNCGNALVKVKNLVAGAYCGTPYQGGNDDNWWYYYPLTGYTYPVYMYGYYLYTTNFTTTTTQYDHVLYSGDYIMDTLSGKTLVLGNARLVVRNGINMTGNDLLEISQMGSLLMYVDGSSSKIAGNGIVNDNGYAVNCQIYFTQNTTSLQIDGNGSTSAVIIAPDAAVTMNGGGHDSNDFVGALMGSSIKMNGHYKFHYDEALNKRGATGRYIVSSWDEIKPN
jgi:hypothetical protein